MKRYIRRVLRGVNRFAGLPIGVRLRCFAQANVAFLGVVGLKTSQQTDVAPLLMTLAIAIHLRQPVGDLRRFRVDLYSGGVRELCRGEHGRVSIRHRLRGHRHPGHFRHRGGR